MLLVIALLLSPFAALGQTMEPYETIDLDLSQMSGTIAYAQVYQMISDPEAYVGKIIRMTGYFDVFEDQDTGIVYTSCVIPDAAACCAQGLEFEPAGGGRLSPGFSRGGRPHHRDRHVRHLHGAIRRLGDALYRASKR